MICSILLDYGTRTALNQLADFGYVVGVCDSAALVEFCCDEESYSLTFMWVKESVYFILSGYIFWQEMVNTSGNVISSESVVLSGSLGEVLGPVDSDWLVVWSWLVKRNQELISGDDW